MDIFCDAATESGERCTNPANYWVLAYIDLTGEVEEWPMAICEYCREQHPNTITRLGPDRREEYARRNDP